MVRAFLPMYLIGSGFICFIIAFTCFMQLAHFALDLEPLEHYFNSSITFQLEQPFNPTINTIGTGMTHSMSSETLFQ